MGCGGIKNTYEPKKLEFINLYSRITKEAPELV